MAKLKELILQLNTTYENVGALRDGLTNWPEQGRLKQPVNAVRTMLHHSIRDLNSLKHYIEEMEVQND